MHCEILNIGILIKGAINIKRYIDISRPNLNDIEAFKSIWHTLYCNLAFLIRVACLQKTDGMESKLLTAEVRENSQCPPPPLKKAQEMHYCKIEKGHGFLASSPFTSRYLITALLLSILRVIATVNMYCPNCFICMGVLRKSWE